MPDPDPITILEDLCRHLEGAHIVWHDPDAFAQWCRDLDAKLGVLVSVAPALLVEINNLKESLAQFQLTMAV
jgi:hypothetical protein